MATKASVRDTGIVALVPCELPRPRKGGARVGGITLTQGAVAIHAGESERDATDFAAAMRASYARYIEAHPAQVGTGHDMTTRGTDAKTRKPLPLRPIPPTPSVAAIIPPGRQSDGLAPHTCAGEDTPRKVRSKYLDRVDVPYPDYHTLSVCPACAPLALPARPIFTDYGPHTLPALVMLDVARPALPSDLYEPIAWRKAAPRPVARPVKAAAVRKPRKAAAPRKIESRPEPRMAPVAIAEPARKPERGYRPAPCNRCGRNDFSTDKGREWHLANNSSCANRRKPERHTYTMIGG